MQDMTPRGERGDRSIRNIPVPSGHRPARSPAPLPEETQPEDPNQPMYEEDFSNPPPRQPRRRSGFFGSRFFWVLVVVVVVCAAIGLLMSTLFVGATVTVTPRSATVTAPATIEAQINAPAGTLPYQVVNSSRTASTTVPA